jgi:hypothetical protein
MPTPLKPEKPLVRETAAQYRGRPLILELHPAYLLLREKGRRTAVSVDYRAVLDLGYKMLWRQAQSEKKAAKKGRRP